MKKKMLWFFFFSRQIFLVSLGGRGGLRDGGLTFSEGELDVARRAHVGTSATVGTVGTTAHAGGLIDLDVGDDELVGIKTLLSGVGFGVLQESHHGDDGLTGPATLGETTEFLSLGGAADLTVVTLEGNTASLGEDLAVVLLSLAEGHSLDGVGGFEGVLEVASEVRDLGEGSLGLLTGTTRVGNHCFERFFLSGVCFFELFLFGKKRTQ